MKKLLLILSLVLTFSLTACGNKSEKADPVVEVEKQDLETTEEDQAVLNEDKDEVQDETNTDIVDMEEEVVLETGTNFDESKFIIDTFNEYGLNVSINDVIVKHEGNNKVAAIYKELVPKSRPNISKLIFLTNGGSPEILHLQVNNKVIK